MNSFCPNIATPDMPRSLPVNQIAPVGVGTDPLGLAYPLNEFYRRNSHSLPPLEEIDPARIPEPWPPPDEGTPPAPVPVPDPSPTDPPPEPEHPPMTA